MLAAAAVPLLQHGNATGIIIGTSEGNLEEASKFLRQIITYSEGSLTPGNFVQGTPNALATGLSIGTKHTGYNITHVHRGCAFENALIDASMHIEANGTGNYLVGAVDEICSFNQNIEKLSGQLKAEPLSSANLLSSGTPGTVLGEGACSYMLSASMRQGAMAKLIDTGHTCYPCKDELTGFMQDMLSRNGLKPDDIQTVVAGYSGDSRSDWWYDHILSKINPPAVHTYKNIFGEFPTSSAMAFYMACSYCASGVFPGGTALRSGSYNGGPVLIYSHYKEIQHSFIIVKPA
jgi:3-oxoacyl-(acyl-carrier-protein) synthase